MTDTCNAPPAAPSALDMLEKCTPAAAAHMLEAVRHKQRALKAHMDTGLCPADMDKARVVEQGLLAAEDIVVRLFH